MSRKLPHYLRIERKRSALTQRDIAELLGVRAPSKVSRYEQHRRLPPLKTAFAYEVIFGKPLSELFGATFDEVRTAVRRRAPDIVLRRRLRNPVLAARRERSITVIATR